MQTWCIVRSELVGGDGADAAADARQVLARVAESDPVHQAVTRLQCTFVPRIA